MDDAASSSALKRAGDRARHTLTIPQVAQQLADAGVPRSTTRIAYFCRKGHLDAGYLPSPTGPQWYVDPASIAGLIGDLRQFDEQQRRRAEQGAASSGKPIQQRNADSAAAGASVLQPGASGSDNPLKPLSANSGAPSSSPLQPGATGDDDKGEDDTQHPAAYVGQLEKRIEEKDKQIDFLQDELKDRRDQIKGMKEIIVEQKQLLESMNKNTEPIFKAIARGIEKDGLKPAPVEPRIIDAGQTAEASASTMQ